MYCDSREPKRQCCDGAYFFCREDGLHGAETLYFGIDSHSDIGCPLEIIVHKIQLLKNIAKYGYDAMIS